MKTIISGKVIRVMIDKGGSWIEFNEHGGKRVNVTEECAKIAFTTLGVNIHLVINDGRFWFGDDKDMVLGVPSLASCSTEDGYVTLGPNLVRIFGGAVGGQPPKQELVAGRHKKQELVVGRHKSIDS